MLNVIWGFFLIGGILTGAFLGRMDLVTNAVIDGGRNAVELAFTKMCIRDSCNSPWNRRCP